MVGAEFGEPQTVLERGRERGALFARLDCEAGILRDEGIELLIALARLARSMTKGDLEKTIAYARALTAW